MQPGEIREHLIDRLAAIYGAPKAPDGLSAELVKYAPASSSPADLDWLADRLIETRKARGFPSIGELIAAMRSLTPSRVAPREDIPGEINFDGEIPMTWIFADDPRWDELCDIARKMEPPDRQGRPSRPYPMTSKYAPGVGRFFRTAHVRSVPISNEERAKIAALYAKVRREAPGPSAQVAA
jgi:hypothetical protein